MVEIQSAEIDLRLSSRYRCFHIVFGATGAGGLKQALKGSGLDREEKVISFPDFYAIGPITNLEYPDGLKNRFHWLKSH